MDRQPNQFWPPTFDHVLTSLQPPQPPPPLPPSPPRALRIASHQSYPPYNPYLPSCIQEPRPPLQPLSAAQPPEQRYVDLSDGTSYTIHRPPPPAGQPLLLPPLAPPSTPQPELLELQANELHQQRLKLHGQQLHALQVHQQDNRRSGERFTSHRHQLYLHGQCRIGQEVMLPTLTQFQLRQQFQQDVHQRQQEVFERQAREREREREREQDGGDQAGRSGTLTVAVPRPTAAAVEAARRREEPIELVYRDMPSGTVEPLFSVPLPSALDRSRG